MIDTHELTRRIDLKTLAEEAGAVFRHGNSSFCPLHHGADNLRAFHVYQGQDGRWRWKCFTNCPEGGDGGDAIAFYMRWKDVDFRTACRELARRAGMDLDRDNGHFRSYISTPPLPPPPIKPPDNLWQTRARAFVEYAQAQLWEPVGQAALDYLHAERGLVNDTIREWGLGYNPRDCWDKPERWGLDGGSKSVWLSRGIVVPIQRDRAVWNIKIRRPLPGDSLAHTIGPVKRLPDVKFSGPRGARAALFGADRLADLPLLILTEGEFDTLITWQAAGDLADVASLGGTKHKLDFFDLVSLISSWRVLAMYDLDEAGRGGNAYLCSISQRVVAVEPPAQDLTAYWQQGGQLRRWLATLVMMHLERLLNDLDSQRHPDLWGRWRGILQRAQEAVKPVFRTLPTE
ncbi:MAG: CHC2 zinc finger domain-containing protein [Anaerolineae bacterium]